VTEGTSIRNIIVSGAAGKTLTFTGGAQRYDPNYGAGGVAGLITGSGTILENIYCSLALKLSIPYNEFIPSVRGGGIAAYIQETGDIRNCVWNGSLESSAGITDSQVYFGGIVGLISVNYTSWIINKWPHPAISAAVARGDITIRAQKNVNVGGLVGSTDNSQVTDDFTCISDSYYENGAILVETGGETNVGGAFGRIGSVTYDQGSKITNCYSRAGSITVSKPGGDTLSMGGFAGLVYAPQFVTACYSACPLTLSEATGTGDVYAGGFIGFLSYSENKDFEGWYATGPVTATGHNLWVGGFVGATASTQVRTITFKRCYATGPVSSFATGTSYTGGFAGETSGFIIEECWASGSVTAKSNPGWHGSPTGGGGQTAGFIYAGGLAGRSGMVKNCYALGDVLADIRYTGSTSNDEVYAGGLLGDVISNSYSEIVSYCFAKGNVTAQSNGAASANVFAGGILGIKTDNWHLNHCAALNDTVIAKGGTARNSARVGNDGYYFSSYAERNYAQSEMFLEFQTDYRYAVPAPVDPLYIGHDMPDGENATPGTGAGGLGTSNFWTSTMGFNSSTGSPAGTWDMTGISRGYPRLKNVGGQ
jgi:hypothetical protein